MMNELDRRYFVRKWIAGLDYPQRVAVLAAITTAAQQVSILINPADRERFVDDMTDTLADALDQGGMW